MAPRLHMSTNQFLSILSTYIILYKVGNVINLLMENKLMMTLLAIIITSTLDDLLRSHLVILKRIS